MANQKISLEKRFWNKVNKQSGHFGVNGLFPTECWEWTGYTEHGYGKINANDGRKILSAHRVSLELNGICIPHGMCVLHKCDNRLCVNPEHLFIGTRRDNNLDMKAKKRARSRKGVEHHNSKLTELDVLAIRQLASQGISHAHIAKSFGICRPNVGHILSGRIWKDVI